jgi:phage/plasmid-associated DNA primase
LKAEASGILHLMISACQEWQRVGLSAPSSVTEATQGLFRELDPLGRFIDECLRSDVAAFTATAELVKAYGDFLSANGEAQYFEQKQLISDIKERSGYRPSKQRNENGQEHRGLRGVRLLGPRDACDTCDTSP